MAEKAPSSEMSAALEKLIASYEDLARLFAAELSAHPGHGENRDTVQPSREPAPDGWLKLANDWERFAGTAEGRKP